MSNMHRTLSLFATAVLLTFVTSEAQAQIVKPFKISGSGSGPFGVPLPGQPARPHWVVGEATHLGHHYGEGTVQTLSVDPVSPPGTITGRFGSGSPFVFTGANGDKLACDYGDQPGSSASGTFVLTILDVLGILPDGSPILLVEALWTADFVVKPAMSTGRFAGATGGWVMYARSEPFVLGSDQPVFYSWEGTGQVQLNRGRR
ncbi:hypothetical protein GC170_21380 [bacterium]|nr:hypothetical protein [bacterium]